MVYSELLRKPQWQKRRLEIMSLDGFSCLICGDENEMLNVHHLVYIAGRKPWEYADEMLVTLCDTCHAYHHANESAVSLVLSGGCARSVAYAVPGTPDGHKAAWIMLEAFLPRLTSKIPFGFVFFPQGEDAVSYGLRFGKARLDALCATPITATRFLFDELAGGFDLSSDSGRNSFADCGMLFVRTVRDSEFRAALVRELKERSGIAPLGGTTPTLLIF